MNTTINVRGLTEEEYTAVQAHASAARESIEGWTRGLIRAAIAAPITRQRYAYRCMGPGTASIKRYGRYGDALGETVVVGDGWSREQADTIQQVKLLVQRNAPGDRETAVGLLKSIFELVVEVGV